MHTIFFSATLKILSSLPFDNQKSCFKSKANISYHDAKRAWKPTGSACAKWVSLPPLISLRSMAVLSSRAQERRSREIRARSARERAAKPPEKEKPPARIRGVFDCRPLHLILTPGVTTCLVSISPANHRLDSNMKLLHIKFFSCSRPNLLAVFLPSPRPPPH